MLLPLCLGCFGFVLFFLYDINSITVDHPIPRSFFLIGNILVLVATVLCFADAFRQDAFAEIADIPLLLFALLSLIALLYSLFFALPFEVTYVSQESGRQVYDKGMYALCRHPGVLFFFFTYLFAGIAALPSPLLVCGMIYSFLNFIYIVFQDIVTFPKTFSNYSSYRKTTPFLIPNPKSIRHMLHTLKK